MSVCVAVDNIEQNLDWGHAGARSNSTTVYKDWTPAQIYSKISGRSIVHVPQISTETPSLPHFCLVKNVRKVGDILSNFQVDLVDFFR
jgi:hypothetical protein